MWLCNKDFTMNYKKEFNKGLKDRLKCNPPKITSTFYLAGWLKGCELIQSSGLLHKYPYPESDL